MRITILSLISTLTTACDTYTNCYSCAVQIRCKWDTSQNLCTDDDYETVVNVKPMKPWFTHFKECRDRRFCTAELSGDA